MSARRRLAATLLVVGLVLSACGADDESAPETATAAEEGSEQRDDDTDAASDADPAAAADADAAGSDGSDGSDGQDGAATSSDELTAQDGWNGVHDVAIPDPGHATLTIAGQDLDLEVQCHDPGPLEEHGYQLFRFLFEATGEDEDGRAITVTGSRVILDVEEAQKTVYDYEGQENGSVQITASDGEINQVAIAVSPSDDDPHGEQLPLLHVEQSGAFTVDDEIPAFALAHEDALEGHARLAGRCQDGWPSDL